MENIKKAIKHFECMKSDAVAVLDSGFGTKPNESNTVYKNRKLYAELAISALEKQIPRKVDTEITSKVKALDMDANKVYTYSVVRCPSCGRPMTLHKSRNFCEMCGQALDWSDTE